MALTEQHKSSIRRHLGYRNIGISGGVLGANSGGRFMMENAQLETRLKSLIPIDEAAITGLPYSVIVLNGTNPNSGDQIVLQISGGGLSVAQTITAIASAGQTKQSFAFEIANACARDPEIAAAMIQVRSIPSDFPEIQFVARSAFSIAITSQTGNTGASVSANGAKTDIYQTIDESDVYGLLPICNKLYSLIGTANDRMGVAKADVFTARRSEYRDRRAAYDQAVLELAQFIVAPLAAGHGQISNLGIL